MRFLFRSVELRFNLYFVRFTGLGFWNSTTQTIQWMNLLILNSAPMDKIAEEANLLLVNAFLNAHPTTKPSFTVPATPAAEVKTEL